LQLRVDDGERMRLEQMSRGGRKGSSAPPFARQAGTIAVSNPRQPDEAIRNPDTAPEPHVVCANHENVRPGTSSVDCLRSHQIGSMRDWL
jgi:hypothetical protein